MNIENLCVNCMHETFDGESCTNCDFNKQTYQPKYNHLPMGRILYGKYLVGEVLGEGGFGITYLGFDLKLEIKVAIKEYYPNGLVTRENNTTVHSYTGEKSEYFQKGKQRFLDEAKTLAKFMNKPGVVSVNDFFAENSTVYIVMEYIDGVTL
ncbi:MAG: serine/threonine protein kinase, partial [Clostridia bacterium]